MDSRLRGNDDQESLLHPYASAYSLRHGRVIQKFVEHRMNVDPHTHDFGFSNVSKTFDGLPPASPLNGDAVLPVLERDTVKVKLVHGQQRDAAPEHCLDRAM